MCFWSNVFSNLFGDLGAAAVLACLAWLSNKARALRLRKSLTKSFGNQGVNFSGEGFGVSISNKTSIDVVVRCVLLSMKPRGSIKLNYKGPDGDIGWDAAQRGGDVAAVIEKTDDSREFIILPAHTSGRWIVPLAGMRHFAKAIAGGDFFAKCKMLVEYPTLFGGRKLMETEADEVTLKLINESAKGYLQWNGDRPRSGPATSASDSPQPPLPTA